MRLEKIKLAGFKSFVDPTVLELRSSLVAVVGPNGCGKSNIIDAIRWVMGESSAKNLRGESMSDVIFNGSTSRKPVGQASIELVFDNSDGSLGGEYARFSEISVRRQASRDGQSSYFLNNTRCRRKDITDVFLGTGLGPRSYAIIEQGMISRVIEARPEELRSFLEEAAGISLYRKRRQETETRIRHTRENLERLNDLNQEIEKQLERLKRQSEAAERYKQYKETHDRLEGELSALRWQVLRDQLEEKANSVRTFATSLEEKFSLRASLDLALEKLRIVHTEKMDIWKAEQGQFYDIGTQIARVEQTLTHHRERWQALEQDLVQAERNYQQTVLQIEQDEMQYAELKENLEGIQPENTDAELLLQNSQKTLLSAEEAMRHWAHNFEVFQQDAEKPQRAAEVEKARIEQLERQSRDAKMQFDRLQKERSEIDLARLENQLSEFEQEKLEQESENSIVLAKLNSLNLEIVKERDVVITENKRLDELRSRLQSAKGRLASLEALQQAALGKTNASVKAWLKTKELEDAPRLIDLLSVESGYERAVETVLGNALEAICIPGVASIATVLSDLTEGSLAFIDGSAPDGCENPNIRRLAHKVKASIPVSTLLAGVYVVDELNDAILQQKSLKPGESVITRDGIWIGPNWLKVYRGSESHNGILAREAELKELGMLIATLKENAEQLEDEITHSRQKIASLEGQRETLHQNQQNEARVFNTICSKITAERTRLEHLRGRFARLQDESIEHQQKIDFAEEEIALGRMNLQIAIDGMETYSKKRTLLQTERDNLRDLLQKASQDASFAQEKSHALALKAQTLMTQKQAIEEGIKRLTQQQALMVERRSALKLQVEGLKEPEAELRETLEELLIRRISAEEALMVSRSVLDDIEQTLRSQEKQRNLLEEEAATIRTKLEQVRMDWQALEVRTQTVQEKLVAAGTTIDKILETLPEDASEPVWASELEQVIKRIERLGAINLAAIEEYQSESERKNYLDSQQKDLNEALETLENAIRKIDKETRTRFKETFEKVNSEFQVLFPVLFGGGQAYLELVGDDLLEAGVTVMARPPGKRNSSIHLLSGGEKALTAVAMVFAIFQLNPAPFCILDEVDAPLDDANVGRFCSLVKRLSDTVQFIFVTHNKVAMEMAHHLVGVTMKEPGVSRLVSVDVEQAAALAAN